MAAIRRTVERVHRPGPSGTGPLLRLLDAVPTEDRVADSWFEEWLAGCLQDAGLPPIVPQCPILDATGRIVARTDIGIPSVRLGLEAHSRRFHWGPIRRQLDEPARPGRGGVRVGAALPRVARGEATGRGALVSSAESRPWPGRSATTCGADPPSALTVPSSASRAAATAAQRSVADTGPAKLPADDAVAIGDHEQRHAVDAVAVVDVAARPATRRRSTATSSLASTSALATTSAHVWHVADVNTATSHGASGRAKSARSSCVGHPAARLRRRLGPAAPGDEGDGDGDDDDRGGDEDAVHAASAHDRDGPGGAAALGAGLPRHRALHEHRRRRPQHELGVQRGRVGQGDGEAARRRQRRPPPGPGR